MLERARQFLAGHLRKFAGEAPGGVTSPIVRAVERGEVSLKGAESLVRFVEVMHGEPPNSLQGAYEKAIKEMAKAHKPSTPRQDPLLY